MPLCAQAKQNTLDATTCGESLASIFRAAGKRKAAGKGIPSLIMPKFPVVVKTRAAQGHSVVFRFRLANRAEVLEVRSRFYRFDASSSEEVEAACLLYSN